MDFHIISLTFSGGEMVPLERGNLLLLVGPNNSGKSVALREIGTWFAPPQERGTRVVVTSVEFTHGAADELLESVRRVYPITELPNRNLMARLSGGHMREFPSSVGVEYLYEIFYPALIQRLDTETRLIYTNPVGRIEVFGREVPSAGIHWLQKDEGTCKRVSAVVRAGFGGDLLINWGGGSSVGFHFGDAPVSTTDEDRVSQAYLEKLNQLPRLEQLGDGIRSFVATVIAAHVGPHPLLLIDEPEAFLHPPQAARLGQVLGRLISDQRRQAIIATHSADFIRGALAGSNNVAICRLERSGPVNHARLLDAGQVQALWSSPLLRSSQAIAGLFNEGVVVCEADADARFYETVLARVASSLSRPVDLYFVHGNGKGGLAALAGTYRRLNIRTAVIADIDLLKNQSEFAAVCSALGGDESSIAALYSSVTSQLSDKRTILSIQKFISDFKQLLSSIEKEDRVSSEAKRRAIELVENAADWSEAKKYGVDKLKGGARLGAKKFLETCQEVGLFLVPKGELEGWWRDGPATKREWITAALRKFSAEPNEFADAQRFVADICTYFGYQ